MIANYPNLNSLLYANLPNGIAWAMANASINTGKSQKWILQKMRSAYHTHVLQKSEALSILEKLEEYQRLINAAIEEIKAQYPG